VTIGSVGGFAGTVNLSLSGLSPSQGTWTFSPSSIAGAGTATLSITTVSSLAAGTYPLTITGSSGSTTHSVPVSLVVTGDFNVAISPSSLSLARGRSGSYSINVTGIGGFNGNVTLSIAGLPSGATASFSPNPVRAPGTSALTVRTTASATRGTFTLKITAKSGTLVHQATATLTVT
jgi:uncharacterized membrane protein